jgi:hypothetical protein
MIPSNIQKDSHMENGFTPGPWGQHECYDASGARLVSYDVHGPHAHSLNGVAVLASVFGNEANARLIAAAPELFEALGNTLALARLKFGNLDPDANTIFAKADAVLAKAHGDVA